MGSADAPRLKAAGLLLAGGWVVFWAGAINPLAFRLWGPAATHASLLATVAERPGGWLAIAVAFALGGLLTAAGFVVLGIVLRGRGEAVWSELGQWAFTAGLVLWLASLAFRATATSTVAEQVARTGVTPEWYGPLWSWAGALFALYMVLAYLAVAAYGASLRATRLAPRWSRVLIVFGVVAALGFVARVPLFNPPLMVHPVPGLLGLFLMARSRRL